MQRLVLSSKCLGPRLRGGRTHIIRWWLPSPLELSLLPRLVQLNLFLAALGMRNDHSSSKGGGRAVVFQMPCSGVEGG